MSDEAALAAFVDEVIAANPDDVAQYRAGDDKLRKKKRGFFMGELMKRDEGPGQRPGPQPLLDDRLDA